MPQSASAEDVAGRPVAVAIKQALDNMDQAKLKKEEILKEIVDKLSNLNLIEELMEVHQQTKQKDAVFQVRKDEFNKEFQRMSEQESLITASNNVITQNIGEFQNLKKSIAIDPTRQQFFQRIDLALMCQQDLENMLS